MIVALLHAKADNGFNRYTVTYTSPIPLELLVEYELNGATRREICYLEAGEDMTFSSYIDTYLTGEVGDAGVINLTARQIALGEAPDLSTIKLKSVTVEQVSVIAKETYFFENERYRIGVELAWGGGLSYLADKKCPVEDLENILNHYDAGRLVQQSYYGRKDAPYEQGSFMNMIWRYNPVQGGDRGKFKSKLIDCKISEHEVYIKCRPRDWGQVGGDTYSYMENTYRLKGDLLWVDNRFVDFSGWEHPESGQELPAFYTVSYLKNYYFYEGDKPWTNAPLTLRDDLPFWGGDSRPQCTFKYPAENTERWAAFVDDELYGLGIYAPGSDIWVAGRHRFNGSKDPAANPTNYIAPYRRMSLVSFKPLTYSYMICAGKLDEIRAEFTQHKDSIDCSALESYNN